jgi:Activator of Hsp90 ATPase homolog 1-like protein
MAEDFSMTIDVPKSPSDVLAAVRDPRAWWSVAITGPTADAGDEWVYSNGELHACRIRVEHVSPERVEWRVLANQFNFIEDPTEWVDTRIVFEISPSGTGTSLRFTHVGLVPEYECFEVCKPAWTHYVGTSLRNYLLTGVGKPNGPGTAWTEAERVLSARP